MKILLVSERERFLRKIDSAWVRTWDSHTKQPSPLRGGGGYRGEAKTLFCRFTDGRSTILPTYLFHFFVQPFLNPLVLLEPRPVHNSNRIDDLSKASPRPTFEPRGLRINDERRLYCSGGDCRRDFNHERIKCAWVFGLTVWAGDL